MNNPAEIVRHIQGLIAASKQHATAIKDALDDIGAMVQSIRSLDARVTALEQQDYTSPQEDGSESEEESAEA
jgi:hypothetical protein